MGIRRKTISESTDHKPTNVRRKSFSVDPILITCYLCHQKVHERHWTRGLHQMDCAMRNAKLLQSMPVGRTPCGRCGGELRRWTLAIPSTASSRHLTFQCEFGPYCRRLPSSFATQDSTRDTAIPGIDCWLCFKCDYAICCDEPLRPMAPTVNLTPAPPAAAAQIRRWSTVGLPSQLSSS